MSLTKTQVPLAVTHLLRKSPSSASWPLGKAPQASEATATSPNNRVIEWSGPAPFNKILFDCLINALLPLWRAKNNGRPDISDSIAHLMLFGLVAKTSIKKKLNISLLSSELCESTYFANNEPDPKLNQLSKHGHIERWIRKMRLRL